MKKKTKKVVKKTTTSLRKTVEALVKKVETLENQSFAQKLYMDELENKLVRAEEAIKNAQDPFSWTVPLPPLPPVAPPPPVLPPPLTGTGTLPVYYPYNVAHTCIGGLPDWTGSVWCTTCGAHISGPVWTVTSTSDKTTFCLTDPTLQSSSQDDVLEFDIHVDLDSLKK